MQRKIAIARAKRGVSQQPKKTLPIAAPDIENDIAFNNVVERTPPHNEDAEITPEQLAEINSLVKMYLTIQKQDIAIVNLLITPLIYLCSIKQAADAYGPSLLASLYVYLETCPSQESFDNNLSIAKFSTMVLSKELIDRFLLKIITKRLYVKDAPELSHPEKLNVRDANRIINELKNANIKNKSDADYVSKFAPRILMLILIISFLMYYHGADPWLVSIISAISFAAILPSLINDTRSIALNYHSEDKLRNKKNILDNILKNTNLGSWYIHHLGKIESSFFSLQLSKGSLEKKQTKLACYLVSKILKKYGFAIETSLKHLSIAMSANTYISEEISKKMNTDISLQLEKLAKISALENQLLLIGKKLKLFFAFFPDLDGDNISFSAQAAILDTPKDIVEKMQSLFGHVFSYTESTIHIKGIEPVNQDAFNAFINSLQPVASSSDVIFVNESKPAKNPARFFNKEKPQTDEKPKNTAPTSSATVSAGEIISFPSGFTYDPAQPHEKQKVHPFISSNVPGKFFAASLLTEEDFSTSSITYLANRFQEQVTYPTTATERGTQGFIFNLFGSIRDPQGKSFTYNGKIKIKGEQVGDARAYFTCETDPKSGATLCLVKGWRAKTHK